MPQGWEKVGEQPFQPGTNAKWRVDGERAEPARARNAAGTEAAKGAPAHGAHKGARAMSEHGMERSTGRKLKQLWMVEDRPATAQREAKSFWTKVGVAFENRDGSWSLELAAVPVNGRLQMRDPAPKDEGARAVQ